MTDINFIPSKEELQAQKNRISKRSSIGRSKNYLKLLDYLLEKEQSAIDEGNDCKSPKEIEIAIDVFGKDTNFSPGDDATVRVHISNLRKKLEAYYQDEGDSEPFFITIPTGGYRMVFTANPNHQKTDEVSITKEDPVDAKPEIHNPKKPSYTYALIGLVLVSLIIHASLIFYKKASTDTALAVDTSDRKLQPNDKIRTHKIWEDLPKKDSQVIIAIGEKDILNITENGDISSNNNSYQYISRGKAIAYRNILALFNDNHRVHFKLAAELTAREIRQFSIIYIGDFQSMGILSNYFDGSNYSLDETGSVLSVKNSSETFTAPKDFSDQYSDYGLFAKIDSLRKNKIYILAGFTDSAVLQMSWYFSRTEMIFSSPFFKAMQKYKTSSQNNFELLFKVQSLKGIDLSHEIIMGNTLDNKAIWK